MDGFVLFFVVAIILLALLFDYTNGFNDSAAIVAAMISSGAMSTQHALLIAAGFEFLGAYFLGTAVAMTVGKAIVAPATIGLATIAAALVGAIAWNYVAWYFGMPSSSSHALIGGLLGAVLVTAGTAPVDWRMVSAIYVLLLLSPVIGFTITYLLTKSHLLLFRRVRPSRANVVFSRLQILFSVGLALSHGTNDAQKSMGIITMSLVLAYPLAPTALGALYTPDPSEAFVIPRWVIAACSLALALGIAQGGFRIMKTVGTGFYRIRPVHGFTSLSSAAGIIYTASLFGFPVSTTQISSASILGAGSAQRFNAVRWGTVKHMLVAWFVTIPASGLIGALSQPAISLLTGL
ncbi:MAG: inorganic phosphate transporter [Candidatus Rokuibacteriota bacterium]